MAAPTQALFAASGAAMPAGTPVPNRSRSFETRRSSFHATIEAIVAPAPGMAPISPPIADPRRIGRQSPNSSRALGSAPVMPAPGAVALRPPAAAFSASAMAKKPISIGTSPSPSMSMFVPSVSRGAPVSTSSPTMKKRSPSSALMMPFRGSLPTRFATIERPNTPSPKYSAGPKAIAARESGPSASTRRIVPRIPPLMEENREIPSARPASPRCVMA